MASVREPQIRNCCGYDFASGVHKYLYAADEPVDHIDPTGHDFSFFDPGELAFDFVFPLSAIFKPVVSPYVNGPPTHVGDILDEYFSAFSKEKVWIMGPDDHYTKFVRQWQPVIDAVNDAKEAYESDSDDWEANHTTTAGWAPGASYAADPRAWHKLVSSPPGTDPGTCEANLAIWKNSGYQTHALYTASIGSFDIYVTLDNPSTIKIWMFNLMSRKSFGRYAGNFPTSGQANQWMWWDWTESGL